jgi:ascorbate-specific PTS system EIIC-type component UlaA
MDPAWELSRSMAVNDRMVLVVRAVAVFAVNAALGLAASAASGLAASVTFGWLVPMTAVAGLALATATVARSANAGVVAGTAGWAIVVLAIKTTSGQWSAAITDWALLTPYLIFTACCVAVVVVATRVPKGES